MQVELTASIRTAFALLAVVVVAAESQAACDTIPSANRTFRSARGSVDRPFAAPGQVLQIQLDRGTGGCDRQGRDFHAEAADHVVTFMFRPAAGIPHAVVLADDCSTISADSCGPAVVVDCRLANPAPLTGPIGVAFNERIQGKRRLQVRFPGTDALAGVAGDLHTLTGPVAIAVTSTGAALPCALAAGRCTEVVTPDMIACMDELFERDGTCAYDPANIDPTFPSFTALPPANDYRAVCTQPDSVCSGGTQEVRFAVDVHGNVLLPIDWRGVLTSGTTAPLPRLLEGSTTIEARLNAPDPIRFPGSGFLGSYSPAGIPLPPLFEPTLTHAATLTLLGTADAPDTVLRLARRGVGRTCAAGARGGLVCRTAADCPGGVACGPGHRFLQCSGGGNDGTPCTADTDCPGGACAGTTTCGGGASCRTDADCDPGIECGPNLFEFRDRVSEGGIGPAIIPRGAIGDGICQEKEPEEPPLVCSAASACGEGPCVEYRAEALQPFPIEGLTGTPDMFTFAASEAIQDRDLNGDGDRTDDLVLTIRDRATGERLPIGDGGADGRAVTRVQDGVLHFPAMASAGDVVAFLEPEPLQGRCSVDPASCDRNGDGDQADTILRVFRKQGLTMQHLTTGPGLGGIGADAAALVNGRSLAVSGGCQESEPGRPCRVFARRAEFTGARHSVARASVTSNGVEANGDSVGGTNSQIFVSRDGRFVVFGSAATNLVADDHNGLVDVFLHDRDHDADGIFDEEGPGERKTVRVSVNSAGGEANGPSVGLFLYALPTVSCTPDGRWVVFASDATNLVSGDTNGQRDVFVHDRDADGDGEFDEPDAIETTRVSLRTGNLQGNTAALAGMITADGREVVFSASDGSPYASDVFLHDRASGITTGRLGPDARGEFTISADGRFLGFTSNHALAADDNNDKSDAYVLDRDRDEDGIFDEDGFFDANHAGTMSFTRVTIDSRGEGTNDGDDFTTAPSVSDDGRFATFGGLSAQLVPGDTNAFYDVFLHDRDATGDRIFDELDDLATRRVSSSVTNRADTVPSGTLSHDLSADGRYTALETDAPLTLDDVPETPDVFIHDNLTGLLARVTPMSGARFDEVTPVVSLSDDGRYVAFATNVSLSPADTGGQWDVYVYGPEPSDSASDLSGDGDLDDTVLEVFELNGLGSFTRRSLCPAAQVAVDEGSAAFLRPEAAGYDPDCPWDAPSLDGDDDHDDDVVHVWTGGDTVRNLHCPASAIAMAGGWIGAIIAEAGPRRASVARKKIGPVRVHQVAGPDGSVCEGAGSRWINLGKRGRSIQIATAGTESFAVFIDQRSVIQIFALNPLTNKATRLAGINHNAKEFVIGDGLVAFRTAERAPGEEDLNRDGDRTDDVLQVYDLASRTLYNTGQAVLPCRLAACDPRIPYRPGTGIVTFLTRELDQNEDLDHDGLINDKIVVQIFTVPGASSARSALAGTMSSAEVSTLRMPAVDDSPTNPLRADVAEGAHVFATAGRCIERFEIRECMDDSGCDLEAGEYCDTSRCSAERDACWPGKECSNGLKCRDGRCCEPAVCARRHAVCKENTDCPMESSCRFDLVVAVLADLDSDGVADPVDVCPSVADPLQRDGDGDGVGDACDPARCGNGHVEAGETCDDGNLASGDRCDSQCRIACALAPQPGCRRPTRRGGGLLQIIDATKDERDRVSWFWRQGESTTMADIDDPDLKDDYALCLYGGAGELLTSIGIPSDEACAGGSCWTVNPPSARYRSKTRIPDGVSRALLQAGDAGRARMEIVGVGARLPLPSLPLTPPIRVQLQASRACWEATYVSALRNDGTTFRARSE